MACRKGGHINMTEPSGAGNRSPARTVVDYWQSGQAWWEVALDSHASAGTVAAEVQVRAQAIIQFAHANSPLYRRHYGAWPKGARTPGLRELAPVGKPQLMADFDAWATDRAVTRAGAEAFLADTSRVGEAFLDRYALWTSS